MSAQLLDLATADLYEDNAFRIAGLDTTASGREVRNRRQKVMAAVRVGAADLPTEQELSDAFDTIASPVDRLTHELFWYWGDASKCGCSDAVHAAHDDGVRAHAHALSADEPQSWAEAIKHWNLLFSGGLRDHLRRRCTAIDDPRLDEATADELAAAVPLALVSLTARMAAEDKRYVPHLKKWRVATDLVADAVDRILSPLLDDIVTATVEARRLLNKDDPREAAELVLAKAEPVLTRIGPIVREMSYRRAATVANDAAVLLNNCAVDLGDSARKAGTYDADLANKIVSWLDVSLELVTEAEDRSSILENRTLMPRPPRPPVRKKKQRAKKKVVKNTDAAIAVRKWIDGVSAAGDAEYLYVLMAQLRREVTDPDIGTVLDAILVAHLPREQQRRATVRRNWWIAGIMSLAVAIGAFWSAGLIPALLVVAIAGGCAGIYALQTRIRLDRKIAVHLDPDHLPGGFL